MRSLLGNSYDVISEPLLKDSDLVKYFEFGVVHPAKKHVDYSYAYGISAYEGDNAGLGTRLVKLNVVEGEVAGSWEESGCLCTEPLFVPRPGAEREDDGVVLSIVFTGQGGVMTVALDCEELEEVARV